MKRGRNSVQAAVLLSYLLSALPGNAADGVTVVRGPVTITTPGKYILAQNVQGSSSDFFVINIAANNVHLDLNGFSVIGRNAGIRAADVYGIVVENGAISAQHSGVRLSRVDDFVIRNLSVSVRIDSSICAMGQRGVIEDNRVYNDNDEILLDENSAVLGIGDCEEPSSFTGQIRAIRNEISGDGIGALIECTGCIFDQNTIRMPTADGVKVSGRANRISRNVLDFADGQGIEVNGLGNLILENVVGGTEAGAGIWVRGDASHIEGNLVTGAGTFGLLLTGSDNVYRRNTVRNNGDVFCSSPSGNTDFCDQGADNTSHGDNYMPDRR